MSIWKLVRLNFGRSPSHFGEVGIGLEETSERVRSDTLFSAWITAYARLLQDSSKVKALLQRFPIAPNAPSTDASSTVNGNGSSDDEPPFYLSSTFIYRQISDPKNGMRTIYYLPRPVARPINYPAGTDDLEFAKTFKGLTYLPLPVWQRWYQGDGFTKSDRAQLIAKTQKRETDYKDQLLNQAGTFDYGTAYDIHRVPKIAVDRVTRATNLYHTGFVQFRCKPNHTSGLYFLMYWPESDETLMHDLKAALHFLGEEGLGGERSSGAGRFEPEWCDLPQEWKTLVDPPDFKPTRHSVLSVFWDLPLDDVLLNGACYELQERGGWHGSPFSGRQLRRQSIRMFIEGSVFCEKPQGKLADVTPAGFDGGHRIYRSGVALSLPIRVGTDV